MTVFTDLKEKFDELDIQATEWSEDQAEKYKAWEISQKAKMKKAEQSVSTYFDNLDDQAKNEWESAKAKWDSEIQSLRNKSAEYLAKIEKMSANERAHASHAYAGIMTKLAIAAQIEADKAIGHAVRDRIKAFLK